MHESQSQNQFQFLHGTSQNETNGQKKERTKKRKKQVSKQAYKKNTLLDYELHYSHTASWKEDISEKVKWLI